MEGDEQRFYGWHDSKGEVEEAASLRVCGVRKGASILLELHLRFHDVFRVHG